MTGYSYNLALAFEQIVERQPERPALRFGDGRDVCYDELNRKANRLAGLLLERGVRQGDVVCLSGTKSVGTFACMLACLKLGAPYCVLDPDSPAAWLGKILRTCRPRALFVEKALSEKLRALRRELRAEELPTQADTLEDALQGFRDTTPAHARRTHGGTPAYLMFTSGSTGFPRGAVITHANVLNLISWSIETYGFAADELLTNVNPLFFDNSVFDFYASLFSGASLAPFSKEQVTDAHALLASIDQRGCTSWFSVPSLLIFLQTMKAFRRDNMRSIRRIIFGGEGYPKARLKKLFELYKDRIEFYNVYGPTECTCICSSYRLSQNDFDDLQGFAALGRMADNFSHLILDENDRPAGDDQLGELCLLGPNVGKGYYDDPDATAGSFVQNPQNTSYREPMYRTGDLVRKSSKDGKLYIAGRKDNQIKHMGYRIELEEIEAALGRLEYVSQAAVLHGMRRELSQLVAVVSAQAGIDERTIKKDLKRFLPAYMLPSIIHKVDALPKSPNGKVDRRKVAELFLPPSTATAQLEQSKEAL